MVRKSLETFPLSAAFVLFLVVMAGLVPAILVSVTDYQSTTIEMNESETTVVKSPLSATLNDVNNQQINVSILDSETGEIDTANSINESETKDVVLRNSNISITYTGDIGNNQTIITVESPNVYGWSDIQIAFGGAIGIIICVFFLYLILQVTNMGENNAN